MKYIEVSVVGIIWLLAFWPVIATRRLNKIYKIKLRLIDVIHDYNMRKISMGYLDRVSYGWPSWIFWRTCESFFSSIYKDYPMLSPAMTPIVGKVTKSDIDALCDEVSKGP